MDQHRAPLTDQVAETIFTGVRAGDRATLPFADLPAADQDRFRTIATGVIALAEQARPAAAEGPAVALLREIRASLGGTLGAAERRRFDASISRLLGE